MGSAAGKDNAGHHRHFRAPDDIPPGTLRHATGCDATDPASVDLPGLDRAFQKTLPWRVQSNWSRPRRRTKSPQGKDAIYSLQSCQKVAQLFNCPDFLQADENNQQQALQETAKQMDLTCSQESTGEAGATGLRSPYALCCPTAPRCVIWQGTCQTVFGRPSEASKHSLDMVQELSPWTHGRTRSKGKGKSAVRAWAMPLMKLEASRQDLKLEDSVL